MADSQVPFAYNQADLDGLTAALSSQRLGKYLNRAGFDQAWAMDIYLWNARLSKSLQFPIHVAEVTLRNAVSEHLQSAASRLIENIMDSLFLSLVDVVGDPSGDEPRSG